jgi:excisionase family DNA binding protein
MNENQNKIIDLLKEQSLKIQNIERFSLIAQKSVLTMEEMCLYTGLSKSYAYKLTSKRLVPHSNPSGKCLYFSKEEIDQWLLRNPVKTISQIQKEMTAL